MMLNFISPHLLVFIGSLLLLLPAPAAPVHPHFCEIPDADFEQLFGAPATSPGNQS